MTTDTTTSTLPPADPASAPAPEPVHVSISRALRTVFEKWGVVVANAKWTESSSATAEFIYTRDGEPDVEGGVPAGYAGVQLTSVSRQDIA